MVCGANTFWATSEIGNGVRHLKSSFELVLSIVSWLFSSWPWFGPYVFEHCGKGWILRLYGNCLYSASPLLCGFDEHLRCSHSRKEGEGGGGVTCLRAPLFSFWAPPRGPQVPQKEGNHMPNGAPTAEESAQQNYSTYEGL